MSVLSQASFDNSFAAYHAPCMRLLKLEHYSASPWLRCFADFTVIEP